MMARFKEKRDRRKVAEDLGKPESLQSDRGPEKGKILSS
jgi:hypothetical protein